ncbi:MAG: hypothetical protein ACK4GN_14000 [Runella sp.]
MKKLTPQQLGTLHDHLLRNSTNDALVQELLDHLACEVEQYMWKGYNFELALEKVSQEANTKVLKYLRETYQHDLAMTEEQLQNASLDDIVFEFRNKAYGAYDLRKTYPMAMRNALLLGVGLFLMLMALLSGLSSQQWDYLSVTGVSWIVGMGIVGYVVASWYFKNQRPKDRWAL